jgi:hypothetical protein
MVQRRHCKHHQVIDAQRRRIVTKELAARLAIRRPHAGREIAQHLFAEPLPSVLTDRYHCNCHLYFAFARTMGR